MLYVFSLRGSVSEPAALRRHAGAACAAAPASASTAPVPASCPRRRTARRASGSRRCEPGEPQHAGRRQSPYQENAWGMGEGKRLYPLYNCAPCHAQRRRRDRAAADGRQVDLRRRRPIRSTRPSRRAGRTACRRSAGTSRTQQIWQLVAYVQSMSGPGPRRTAAPEPQRRPDERRLPESRRSPAGADADGASLMPDAPVGSPSGGRSQAARDQRTCGG